MKYKAVLFDLDGTLLDTLGDLTYAVNLTLRDYLLPDRTKEEVRSFVGDGVRKLIERAFSGDRSPEFIDKATMEYKQYYADNMLRETTPYDGVPGLLERLRGEGRVLAVVSNKYDASTKLLCSRFFQGLQMAVGEMEERGIRRKPNPDMIELVMSSLGLAPEETLYVGDSETDVMTANNAGVDCISVTWGFRSKDFLISKGARNIADTVEEFFKVLEELENNR